MIFTPCIYRAVFLASCALTSCAAVASAPSDLDWKAVPSACFRVFHQIGDIVDARDKGDSKAIILERNKTAPAESALPESLIAGVFAYRSLDRPALEAYAMWSCHASGYGLPALPLAAVHAQLRACFSRPAGDPCVGALRDKVLGIPRSKGEQAATDTPDMLAMRRTPTNVAPPRMIPFTSTVPTVARGPITQSCDKPAYPTASLANEETGTVALKYLVDAAGIVQTGQITKSSGFELLDQSAFLALGRCKYAPIMVNGQAVAGYVTVAYVFTLE